VLMQAAQATNRSGGEILRKPAPVIGDHERTHPSN
jgi:hypothetical protein